jgi:hypothetical protein
MNLTIIKVIFPLFIAVTLFISASTFAGTFTPSPAVPNAGSYTLSDIYNKISSDTFSYLPHTFSPADPPADTFVTLTQIWNIIPQINVPSVHGLDSGVLNGGIYHLTDLAVIEPNLTASNIATGTVIFGVVGTKLDLTAPIVTAFHIFIPPSPPALTVNFTFTATDNHAVTGYLVTETPVVPSLTDPNWENTATTTYTFSGLGSKNLYAWAKDVAGNISSSLTDSVTFTSTLTWSSVQSNTNWTTASADCLDWGGRLPLTNELLDGFIDQFRNSGSNPGGFINLQGYWTSFTGYWVHWDTIADDFGNGAYEPGPNYARCIYP